MKITKKLNFRIKFAILMGVFLWIMNVEYINATDLTHQWKSPAFSGSGYSSHVLTIENQEYSRKKAIKEKKEAAEREALRDAANTNLSKFMKNVESGESGTVTFEGTTISYVKDAENVTLTIVDTNGSETVITVPVGDFTF